MKAIHRYLLCGWRTHSEFPLSGVPTLVNDAGKVDVTIQVATGHSPIAKSSHGFAFQHAKDSSLIGMEDVADFEITAGRQIRVWPLARADQKDIEILLFGPAWATLCHQRGILPLHASAVVSRMGITGFAGHSGAGKSTTAALLSASGYELIADDILPVSFDQNSIPGAWPYLRRLKLHRDAMNQLGLTSGEHVSMRFDKERYLVRPKNVGDDRWRRLDRLYVLENEIKDSAASIEQVTGADAVRVLIDQTYHFNFIIGTRRFSDHLMFCSRLASKIPIYRVRRSQLTDAENRFSPLIRAHIEGAESKPRPGRVINQPYDG